jgi:hypothetical protein
LRLIRLSLEPALLLFPYSQSREARTMAREVDPSDPKDTRDFKPDWKRKCMTCGAKPILPMTEMCGVCTFGEAAMANGAWWPESEGGGEP